MSFCLPKEAASKFLQSLKDGTIDPAKLMDMTSSERRNFFSDIVGEDHAKEVNALLESKLLLKDQKRGMVSWAKKVSGITEETRRDIISKIERMDTVLRAKDEASFLEDLASKKLGTEVSFEEARHIADGVKEVTSLKEQIPADSPDGSEEHLAYGIKYVEFQKYVAELKNTTGAVTWKEWITSPSKIFNSIAGTTKSILASFDNSYFGRQGLKMLYTNPDIWVKDFTKSWGDIAKEAFGVDKNAKGFIEHLQHGIDAMDAIKADIYSRKNALNGKYQAMGLDIGISSEEAFPSSLPEKIPLLGRLYKASEAAFNGAALRMRADYADRIIEKAEEFGINTKDKAEAKGLGLLVNSMTGRGNIGKLNTFGGEINSTFFSIKFFKSNLDTLSMHRLGYAVEEGLARDFVRKQAALNLLKITATTAGILYTANLLWPGSVEPDPRSANFGKIKIGKNSFDVTGGMGSLIVLASRIATQASKSTVTNKVTPLNSGKFGAQTELDVLMNFGEGKLSPIAGVLRDYLKGQDYNGNKIHISDPNSARIEAQGLITPLPVQTFEQLQSKDAATTFGLMLLDGLGFSVSSQNPPKKK